MKIVFVGTGAFAVPTLEALAQSRHSILAVVTQPDRPAGRGQELTPSPVKEAALKFHLRIYQPERINAEHSVAQLRYLQPDVLLVCSYGQIVSKDVLEVPKVAALNVHGSLLPRHRGASPVQAAILHRDRETGVTVIWMDEGIDTGDILLAEKAMVRSTDTAQTLGERLSRMAPRVLLKALELLEEGKAPRIPQDPKLATYAPRLTKEDGRIDWSRPKEETEAQIRAMIPWPGAYTFVPDREGKKMLKIFRVIISLRARGKPGEVCRVDEHGILVAAGEKGGLLLREVQLEGKKRMAAKDFAHGFPIAPGMILG
ncbi:methionyl-tRNA formyltransferase [Candidatus Methylacidithermus pantelleriae]|uniref:Methionyl-tRNA formyltransferase n=1 Tax=Candidatus Methylacidithermus pantelleriae TaxID=2744239 RepID=A0A8J2FSE4_9BACT|nr:methionyl-tRNA formyltransferase [Candidatus Methylacidithermus pantelleriae]CAF0695906.1 10-formyltetrahydrofolate:L-methionyl-tRNA(fMet) N-formyltransferase [Candidatus Methylacidithermus pantelleriae]